VVGHSSSDVSQTWNGTDERHAIRRLQRLAQVDDARAQLVEVDV
jgi:hypothetical protein